MLYRSYGATARVLKRMKYPRTTVAVVIILAGVVLAFFRQNDLFGNLLDSMFALAILLPIFLILAFFACIILSVQYELVIVASLIVAVFAFIGTGLLIDDWKVYAVETYVTRAVPVL